MHLFVICHSSYLSSMYRDLLAFALYFDFSLLNMTVIEDTEGRTSAESSRSVRGLGKDASGKPYPRLCNTRRPRLEPGTFRSQAVRLYRLHQARPSIEDTEDC